MNILVTNKFLFYKLIFKLIINIFLSLKLKLIVNERFHRSVQALTIFSTLQKKILNGYWTSILSF